MRVLSCWRDILNSTRGRVNMDISPVRRRRKKQQVSQEYCRLVLLKFLNIVTIIPFDFRTDKIWHMASTNYFRRLKLAFWIGFEYFARWKGSVHMFQKPRNWVLVAVNINLMQFLLQYQWYSKQISTSVSIIHQSTINL